VIKDKTILVCGIGEEAGHPITKSKTIRPLLRSGWLALRCASDSCFDDLAAASTPIQHSSHRLRSAALSPILVPGVSLQATVMRSNLEIRRNHNLLNHYFRSASQPPLATWREVIGSSSGARVG